MTTLNDVVSAYIDCGKRIGFFYAEMILMGYLPKSKPDGKCSDVSAKKRAAFLNDLQAAAEQGVKFFKKESEAK